MLNDTKPEYLGDGAYATIQRNALFLTTGNHDPRHAEMLIVLEPQELKALIKYLRRNNPDILL